MKIMKKVILTILFSGFLFTALIGQQRAKVEKVLNVPVFIYSYPVNEYTENETVYANWSAVLDALGGNASVADKVKEVVRTAKNKTSKGKIDDFDAIIINPDDYSGILISFNEEVSLEAEVTKINNTPVFLYSYPQNEFIEVGEYMAIWSVLLGSDLSTRTKELVRKAKRKVQKGKVDDFDAIIINPDDFAGLLIKYN